MVLYHSENVKIMKFLILLDKQSRHERCQNELLLVQRRREASRQKYDADAKTPAKIQR